MAPTAKAETASVIELWLGIKLGHTYLHGYICPFLFVSIYGLGIRF